jgi:hypothetical protein
VEARAAADLERELATRSARVEELRRGVVWRKPAPVAPPPPTTKPAWSKRPTQTATKYPWSVVFRSDARPWFEICLQGDVPYWILREAREFIGEDLETGGHLWSRERARTC